MNYTPTSTISPFGTVVLLFARLIDRVVSFLGPTAQTPHQSAQTPCAGSRQSVLVLDASGSMFAEDWEPSRLGAAQDAAKAFIQRLSREEPDAHVAIVAYGDHACTLCELTCVQDQAALSYHIDRIKCLGDTNITGALRKADRLLPNNGNVCQVVLLTDGHHNVGANPKRVAQKLKQFAIIESVGIGGSPADVQENLLKSISSAYPDGTKRYRWIGDREKLVDHFHNLAGRITRA